MRGILFLATATLMVASCTKSGNEPEKQGPADLDPPPPPAAEAHTLPVKIVMEAGETTNTYTISYIPETGKIEKIEEEGGNVEFYHYEDDLIGKIQYGDEANGDFQQFEYENKALVKEIHYRGNTQVGKVEYSYPSGTSVVITHYKYENEQWEPDEDPITLHFDANGNLITGKGSAGDLGEIQIDLTYDSNNTSMMNVAGWSKIIFTGGVPLGDNIGFVDIFGRKNNPTKVAVTSVGGTMAMNITYTYAFDDTENPKFPTQITGKANENILFTAEVSYK